jgi:predicted phosphoribosyltransferase
MIFEDRAQAAEELADRLAYLKGTRPLVLAIPRGAVPMGRIIADRLAGELDVVLVRKLRSPFNPEFAIGAIDEAGDFELSADAAYAGGGRGYMEREKAEQLALIRERRAAWSALRGPAATGGTRGHRRGRRPRDGRHDDRGPALRAQARSQLLVCAVPVASTTGIRNVKDIADEVVVAHVPEFFAPCRSSNRDFSEVPDETVAQLLAA